MDLVSFVVQPTWKELLLELVSTEQMDPWDVDVGMVAQKYLEKVREFQAMDLRVPANVILAAALLLRFKSDNLMVEETEEEEYDEPLIQDELLPELVFRVNRPRRRKLTLDELMRSLEEVIRKGRKSAPQRSFLPPLLLEVPEQDMDQKMASIFEKAKVLKDAEGIVLFSALLEERTAEQIAKHIMPVLHLVQEQKIVAWQDQFFGEIFIRITDGEPVVETEPEAEKQAA